MDNSDLITEAKAIIANNVYMTLATASLDGLPWVSPVFYGYDESYNLYWVSDKNARHSRLVRENPRAAITIFDSQAPVGDGDAVYFETTIEEIDDAKKAKEAITYRDAQLTVEKFKVKSVDEVLGAAAWRIYKACPSVVYKLARGEIIDGQHIDKKVEINFKGS